METHRDEERMGLVMVKGYTAEGFRGRPSTCMCAPGGIGMSFISGITWLLTLKRRRSTPSLSAL